MTTCSEYIRNAFPSIDEDLKQYVEDVLVNGADEFEDSEEVYEAVGELLQEVSEDKTEEDIKNICDELLNLLKPNKSNKKSNGTMKILDAPVHLGSMSDNVENNLTEVKSIWMAQRDDTLKVNSKKLEKAQAKLQEKQDKRSNNVKIVAPPKLKTATASQVVSKKDSKLEAKGNNRAQDIRIENFDIAYGDKVLLQGADITLAFGRRYGLVGRNGLGKSTLLKMIAAGQLRIPSHISILHVEQEVIGDDTRALDSVLECDTVRQELLEKEKQISLAINSGSTDPDLNTQLSEVYAQLQNIEADKAPAKASIILNGLGFTPEMQQNATRTFSGGWRMRLALARALFSRPDLLLLDEPTNMLDIKAIIWLENYLQQWPTTLLVVSHDRNFLETVPTDILHLHSQRIDAYRGNYAQFEKTKNEKLKNQQKEYEAQMQQRQHVQEFIDRFRFNANRAALVQSKIKMLEKLLMIFNHCSLPPTSAAITKYSYRVFHEIHFWKGRHLRATEWGWRKTNKTKISAHDSRSASTSLNSSAHIICKKASVKQCRCVRVGMRCSTCTCSHCHGQSCLQSIEEDHFAEPELKPVIRETEVVLRLPETEPLSPPILQLNEVSFRYNAERIIFSDVNIGATMESRICIVGDNGAGKTTLLKIIMGLLSPSSGMRHVHRNLKFGYFSQHHVDQLDMNANSVELLQQQYPGKPIEEYRRQLGSFGVSGDLALQTVSSLSGGQKSRVAFASMCLGRPNFLVLDEPTNHLDIETIEALGKAILKYTGGVILVSHDERLIRMVTNELWVCGNGSVRSIEGGFDEYRKIVEQELEAAAQTK